MIYHNLSGYNNPSTDTNNTKNIENITIIKSSNNSIENEHFQLKVPINKPSKNQNPLDYR